MQKEYRTVLNEAIIEHIERKSRFLASVKPISNEEEALDFLKVLRSKYWNASHNVYAYNIFNENIIQRFSDDGEPSGTAGMPVLEVIKRLDLQNVIVVVTRYFGGTLLGASGLIRSYSKSAVLGIEAAGIVCKKLCLEIIINIEYTLLGKIQNHLLSKKYIIKNIVYKQDVEIMVYIPIDRVTEFEIEISEETNAKALLEHKEKIYITTSLDGQILD